ncbi:Clavaminate synthase-like protein [Dichomitus squalens]|uniref:Clavaminate synthase-like protein n=1 Tax=Dichomitus squalens TaxID=114155 RepID=A0A4Q9N789_9APHY|nr:Clavaminate synthase-like protein [Dichomitus squalens]
MPNRGCMECQCPKLDRTPSYAEFLESYLIPNNPVIIGPSLVSSWPALKHWVTDEGSINSDYLKTVYGHYEVTVADCSTRNFSDQQREQMLFRDVVSLWQEDKGETLYVKDWHLARVIAADTTRAQPDRPFYTTPDIFRDDWMNAYYSACTEDDFRFVYVGASGTFTPLHRDVYTSYSWSTNVCGWKRWWLFPADQTPLLFRKGGEEHMETAYDVRDVDLALYPLFEQARPIVIEQGPGETIFVPSGWYHQVENLTACISINHNWCNSVNLPSLYDSMCAKVTEVEHALEDVKELLSQGDANSSGDLSSSWRKEWIAIVQDLVEKDAGWNWLTFWKMIRHALSLAMDWPCPVDGCLWARTPSELMPSLDYMATRIRNCYEDFAIRPQLEGSLIPGMDEVLADIGGLLNYGASTV